MSEVKLTDAQAWQIAKDVVGHRAGLGLVVLEQQPHGTVAVTLRREDGLDDSYLLTPNGERLIPRPRTPRAERGLRGRTTGTRRARR